jgi:hypothetical protein
MPGKSLAHARERLDAMRSVMFLVLGLLAITGCKKTAAPMIMGVGGSGGGGACMATGGAAGGGAAAQVPGCCAANTSAPPAMLFTAVHDVLSASTPCGFSSCHMGSNARAHLDLVGAPDLHAALVGKPACEAPNLSIVDGSGGDVGLSKSYMWIKLTGPVDLGAALIPDASWGTAGACGQSGQMYGLRMPLTNTDMLLDDTRLAAIRNWICAGAPAH